MSVFGNFFSENKELVNNLSIKTPREIFQDILKVSSGTSYTRDTQFDIFYQVIAFQGVSDGVGCSTLVANTALALARLGLNVCVIDTSILAPSQDILLNTDFRRTEKKDRVDWMDMYSTNKNVLNISKLDSKIGVLSFQDRTIIDLLSSNDNSDMVELALNQLHTKFDIILIDVCHEPSAVATACLQEAHKIIQIWTDSPHLLDAVQPFVTNNTILSIPMDKMRSVVTSMTVDDIPVEWDLVMKQYGFKHLSHVGMSLDIARVIATGKMPFNYPSESEDIQEFNDCIADIVCSILNITAEEDKHKGNITSNDIMDGKVEGTLFNKLKKRNEEMPEIITTLEEADMSLAGVKKVEKQEDKIIETKTSTDNSIVAEYSEHMNDDSYVDNPVITNYNDNGLASLSDVVKEENDKAIEEENKSGGTKKGLFKRDKKKGDKK